MAADVVLEGEWGARAHLEVVLLPAQSPHDLACLAVDLVDGAGRAGGDEQVILVIHIYGVDVEVVVGLEIRLLEADVLQAVPLEEHLAGLLDYPVEHNTV